MGDSLMGDKPISETAQAKPGMLNKLFFSFLFSFSFLDGNQGLGFGEVFWAGGYYIYNAYNLGLQKNT